MNRVCRHKDDDFTLEVEVLEEGLGLHCEVSNWKLSTLKKMYKVFGELKNENRKMMTVTPNPNFAKLFGGRTESVFIHDGIEYEVIVWDTK